MKKERFVNCKICGKIFNNYYRHKGKHVSMICSRDCYNDFKHKYRVEYSKRHKEKLKKEHKCLNCGKKIKPNRCPHCKKVIKYAIRCKECNIRNYLLKKNKNG